jgi:hypothetical protein
MTCQSKAPANQPQPGTRASYEVRIERPLFLRLITFCDQSGMPVDKFAGHAIEKELDHLKAARRMQPDDPDGDRA